MQTQKKENLRRKKTLKINLILILFVIIIAAVPLALQKKAAFTGSDDQAKKAITDIDPNYKPWFKSIWVPPSGEVESLLFAVQAGIGCLVLGYILGYMRGRKKREDGEKL
jgi:cobalt/nickel transport protein